jgi:tRNA G18 (ribose-2'-O)-methylase SpoU
MPSHAKLEWAARRKSERRRRRREAYRRGLRPFAVAAWQISKEHNVGSLVRTAHATACSQVILIGEREWNREAARTAEQFTEIVHLPDDPDRVLNHIAAHGWQPVAIELDDRAVNLFDVTYPERPCFLLGAELGGLPAELLDRSDPIVQIPQWGLVPSLNLAVAGSIVVYDYLRQMTLSGRLRRPAGGLVEVAEPEPQTP